MARYGLIQQIPLSHTADPTFAQEFSAATQHPIDNIYKPLSTSQITGREKATLSSEKTRLENKRLARKWATFTRRLSMN
jgi:hypothetical protein